MKVAAILAVLGTYMALAQPVPVVPPWKPPPPKLPINGAPALCPPNTPPAQCAGGIQHFPPLLGPFGCYAGDSMCIQMRARALQMQQQREAQKKAEQQQKKQQIMKLLNAILGGGAGSGAAEPANGGERMAYADGTDSGGNQRYSSAGSTTSAGSLQANSGRGHAPVVPVFQKWFPKCTNDLGFGDCTFRNDGIWGDLAHQARQSCHNTGEAIDVGLPFVCNGRKIEQDSQEAMQIAMCMADKTNNELGVIFRDHNHPPNMFPAGVKNKHNSHMHIQLRTCGRGRRG